MACKKTDPVEEYLVWLRSVRRRPDSTLRAYTHDLELLSAWCADYGLDPLVADTKFLRGFIGDMGGQHITQVSVNRALSSIRGFYRWLVRTGQREDDPAGTLRNLKAPRSLPVFLWENEMADFANLPDETGILWPERDKAIMLVMYSAGLRISEAAALTVAGLDRDRRGARVIGKGNVERRVFLTGEAQEALDVWLPIRRIAAGPGRDVQDRLFISRKPGPLSVSGLRWIISRYAEQSEVQKKVHPHALRHSFATHLVNSGCDVRIVQELLGHASLSTPQRYTHVDIDPLKQVYSKAHPHSGTPAHPHSGTPAHPHSGTPAAGIMKQGKQHEKT
jgi:integrase/recombinase XerC